MNLATRTGRPVQIGDELRVVGGRQRYRVAVIGGGRAVLVRHVEIVDAAEWVHADERDPDTDPARLLGDA